MKSVLRLEEAAMFAGAIALLILLQVSWYWYLLLLLGPDISALGYLAGNKTGAIAYNLFHHKGIAVICCIAGLILKIPALLYTGLILFGHSSMDRTLGYGLKYFRGFKYTSLGTIGNKATS